MSKKIDDFFEKHPVSPDKIKFLDTDVSKLKAKDLTLVCAWSLGELDRLKKRSEKSLANQKQRYVSRTSLL